MELSNFVEGSNRLSERWAHTFADNDSTVVSGFGVWLLLATLLDGAAGEARQELETATGLQQSEAANAIVELLDSIDDVEGLKTAIAIWVQDTIELLPEFKSKASKVSVAAMPSSQSEFDQWASDATDGLIKAFPLEVKPDAPMVLASALVAKGDWEEAFNEVNGTLFTECDDLDRAAIIEYKSTRISRIQVPAKNGLDVHLVAGKFKTDSPGDVLAAGLAELSGLAKVTHGSQLEDGDKGGCLRASIRPSDSSSLQLSLPQFQIDSLHDLSEHFELFGLKSASDDSRGHFPGMSTEPLAVGDAAQSASMSFGKDGFEAAAIAAIEMRRGGMPMLPKNDRLVLNAHHDRPFGFIVVHRRSKLAIFCGWVSPKED